MSRRVHISLIVQRCEWVRIAVELMRTAIQPFSILPILSWVASICTEHPFTKIEDQPQPKLLQTRRAIRQILR